MDGLAERMQSHHWQGRSWMWDIRDAIGHLDITQVAMTGTHNTATYEIKRSSRFGRDGPEALRSNGALASFVRVFGGAFLTAWSRCQRMTVAEQLEFGIRYFDLRIAPYSEPSTTLYTTHGLLSTKLDTILTAVARFVTNPDTSGEFVLLDFQHIFLSPSDPGYGALFQSLAQIKDLCVTRPAPGHPFPPLSELWRGTQRIFVFIGGDFDVEALSYVCLRDTCLCSPWLNQHNKRDLLRALDANAADTRQGDPNKVFLTQAIVTPNRDTVMTGLLSLGIQPASLRALARNANEELARWFWQRNTCSPAATGRHTNILLLDFPEEKSTELRWDGGSLRGTVVDMCVGINLLRGACVSCGDSCPPRGAPPTSGTVDE